MSNQMIVYHLYKLPKDNLPFWLRYRFYRDHLGSFTEQQILCYHESCFQREWLLQERWEKTSIQISNSYSAWWFCSTQPPLILNEQQPAILLLKQKKKKK